jgi:putative FmdB family regulatory protein
MITWSKPLNVPIYEYRCKDCQKRTEQYFSSLKAPKVVDCQECGSSKSYKIMSGASYHQSEATKTAKLDRKYDKRVNQAIANTRSADPDRVLNKLKPFPK